jgi:hypothetical protein
MNESDPHWPDERYAQGLLHPPSVLVTPLSRSLHLVGCSQRRALTTKISLLKGDGNSGLVGHHFIVQSSCDTPFSPIFTFRIAIRNRGKEMQQPNRRH